MCLWGPFKMEIDVSLDRITISSPIVKHKTAITELTEFLYDSAWEKISDSEFRLSRINENDVSEYVAGLFKNKHQHESFRLDTSNHLESEDELFEIRRVVSFMSAPKITRIDIAFDIKNGSKPNMSHRIYRFNASSAIFASDLLLMSGKNSDIQTIYSGKRKSNVMIRYYDKKAEQKSRRKSLPEDIYQWERLELQLRSNESLNWVNNAKKMLSYFKMPKFENVTNVQERAMLFAIDNKFVKMSDLSKATATKYRKMFKDNYGFDTEYSDLMLDKLSQNTDKIENEINTFMKKIDISM